MASPHSVGKKSPKVRARSVSTESGGGSFRKSTTRRAGDFEAKVHNASTNAGVKVRRLDIQVSNRTRPVSVCCIGGNDARASAESHRTWETTWNFSMNCLEFLSRSCCTQWYEIVGETLFSSCMRFAGQKPRLNKRSEDIAAACMCMSLLSSVTQPFTPSFKICGQQWKMEISQS